MQSGATIQSSFEAWLAGGGRRVGEVAIRRQEPDADAFVLTHWQDEKQEAETLEIFTEPEEAHRLALYDGAGQYRPLKTAPNLRRGWRLEVRGLDALCRALEFFYPAALGVRSAFERNRLEVTPLRETLNRQTGMYAVTKKISNPEADAVIADCCRSGGGCLKTILWPLEAGSPVTSLPPEKFDPAANQLQAGLGAGKTDAFPLLCNEACNLLVAAIRTAVKKPSP